jgi:hypothetical protein
VSNFEPKVPVRNSYHLASYIKKRLVHASLADVYRWIREYRQIPAKLTREIPATLTAPPKMSCVEMIVALFRDVTPSAAESCRLEFLRDYDLFNALDERMVARRHRRVRWLDWHEFFHMAVRSLKPLVVFETGVFDGQSSAIILNALNKNKEGELVSIDLPARETIQDATDAMPETTLPPACQPGWLVPDCLRERYRLSLGDSKELLPQLLRTYPRTDIFFHDSLHTFEHMYFEYTTVWPHLSAGGLLLSDDITPNMAFHLFCKEIGERYVRLERFGAVRKAAQGSE